MSEFSNFSYTGLTELEDLERSLLNYNTFIVNKFINHANDSTNILDFGAGIGTLSSIYRNINPDVNITCLEIDQKQVEIIEKRNFEVILFLNDAQKFDYIFSSNVLEHIDNDLNALKSIYKNLRQGGGLGIFVPAHQVLFSHVDKKFEHFRRYSKKDLMDKVRSSGFEIEYCAYVDFLGFFAWGVAKILKLDFDNENTSRLKFYDKFVWPVSKFIDNMGARFFLGKNLMVLARKP
jgi:SAM-dependent methyltransferase